ncbi:MAG: hypothetical protein M3O25_00495, partial [Actinomycetota bacterium]|nr:hypothetical protein [Actinomycetota bacterium]
MAASPPEAWITARWLPAPRAAFTDSSSSRAAWSAGPLQKRAMRAPGNPRAARGIALLDRAAAGLDRAADISIHVVVDLAEAGDPG